MNAKAEWIREHQWWAMEAFAEHKLLASESWDGGRGARWVVGRPNTFVYRAEIFAGIGGSLIVHGDIEVVRFGHYGDRADAISRLYWMGFCSDVEYYVAQKARIGSGRTSAEQYDEHLAKEELREMGADAELPENVRTLAQELLDGYHTDSREQLLREAYSADSDAYEYVCDVGVVPNSNVIYAHAALNRCASLVWTQSHGRTA